MSINVSCVEDLFRRGAATWPSVRCRRSRFGALLAEKDGAHLAPSEAADLYILAALWDADSAALEAFDAKYLRPQRAQLTKIGLSETGADDVIQVLRERFLMPQGDPPRLKLGDLVGRGDLQIVFRVIAIRTGLNALRSERRRQRTEDAAAAEMLYSSSTALRPILRDEAAKLLCAAVERAIAELSRRNRTLLRLHFSHGMTIDDIGRLYGVHRSTAARWLCRVRSRIEAKVRTILLERRDQSTTNLRELIGLASGQLEVSFDRILASSAGDTPLASCVGGSTGDGPGSWSTDAREERRVRG